MQIPALLRCALLPALVCPGALAQEPAPPREAAPPIAWADFDGDGLDDALLRDRDGTLRLLRNRGDGGFRDVAAEVGLGDLTDATHVSWQDSDGDGDEDLLVGRDGGAPRLYLAQDGLFVEVTDTAGFDTPEDGRLASWASSGGASTRTRPGR